LLLTTGNMAPEAYVLLAAVESWLTNGDKKQAIGQSAARAYARYQKISVRAASRLFDVKP